MAIPTPTSRVVKNPKTRFIWRAGDLVRRAKSRWLELRAKTARRKTARIFHLNQGEPFLSPKVCEELLLLRVKQGEAK
jgi:hypothetical protein